MAEMVQQGRPSVLPLLLSPQGVSLVIAIAAAVAVASAAWMWSQAPDYRVLYANVNDRDAGQIVAALQQMNVPHKLAEGGGAILVPSNQVHEVRLRLAGQGLPRGSQVGFEIMENPRLGTSQFLEQVNYQRALEGELARSIQSIAAVQGARVHLALAKPSPFLRERQKPSASVILNLHPGRMLDQPQVAAIVNLVSSSIPDLPVKNVTVVDQGGHLLSGPAALPDAGSLDPAQLRYQQDLEAAFTRRIEAIIAPIVGPQNVRAQVTADVDFSQIERAEELYKPNQNTQNVAVRSQQTSESAAAGSTPSGVPGALTNQPPAQPTAPVSGSANTPTPAATAAPVNSRRDMSVNYEVDKTVRHVRQSVGNIKRLSVAVVVNHRRVVDAKGKVTHKPLDEIEMRQITDLVKEAVGYTQGRGDTVNVANTPFTLPETEKVPEVPVWKQPGTLLLAKEIGKHALIGTVLLFLVLGVLRPAIRNMQQVRQAALPSPTADPALPAPPQQNAHYEQNLETARQLARNEPKLVANVVKSWVAGNG